ncbi:MAG: Hpt domain-containing protein [Planctomycetales bacterium]|nr:Hpt domain-containing protein [Planctomycetales bacterium]
MRSVHSTKSVHSNLSGDPDLAQQVEFFVSRLPQRTKSLRRYAKKQDWKLLSRAAHQLRGFGQSYGFEELSRQAANLEDACCVAGQEFQRLEALEELLATCDQLRAGAPE